MSAAGSPEVAQAIAKASRHQPDPDIDLNGRRTGKDRCAACSWPWPCDTSILRDALAAAADREARVRALCEDPDNHAPTIYRDEVLAALDPAGQDPT